MTDWKQKIDAYLHDPPEKALDIAWHKQRAESHAAGQMLEGSEFDHVCDHTAAAADRMPWPTYKHLESSFAGSQSIFKHPLGQAQLPIPAFNADLAHFFAKRQYPGLEQSDPKLQFFAMWRFWRQWASDQPDHPESWRLGFLPADTRIPDHTIWAHNSIVSALQGCVDDTGECRPAFLMMQIGPVQEYIAQARRTLDLWSGSYLLSYLMAAGLKHLALKLGPDHVIFPNLCGQPIFDLLLKDDVWAKASTGKGGSLWDSMGYEKNDTARRRLLTPSLPNRFLAIIPRGKDDQQAVAIARATEAALRSQFTAIKDAVWDWAAKNLSDAECWDEDNHAKFDAQSDRFLEISWHVQPWADSPDAAFEQASILPDAEKHAEDKGPRANLSTILEMARKMPKDHRDFRNFQCARYPAGTVSNSGRLKAGWKDKGQLEPEAKLDNPGAAWSALYQMATWQLDAVRQTRVWKAWSKGGWTVGREQNKDSLNGREEAILAVDAEQGAETLSNACGVKHLFKKGELLGASTLIKRIWPSAYLGTLAIHAHSNGEALFTGKYWGMPDTREIADAKPYAEELGDAGTESEKKYFAVLAFDGDQMGKWISGEHDGMPKLGNQITLGANTYLENNLKSVAGRKRPLNPSFHLQFSEMLGNFSNFCARRIVEAHGGRLIYAGGDDVLALVPAHAALHCGEDLRAAFRGDPGLLNVIKDEDGTAIFDLKEAGFVQLHGRSKAQEGEPRLFPAVVPGPATEASVGIAIAHFKSPLQDVVRQAQLAEKRAKRDLEKGGLGRGAIAVTLLKRSGEILEWGCKWDSGGLDLASKLLMALQSGALSSKAPHRFAEMLTPYLSDSTGLVGENASFGDTEGFAALLDEIIQNAFQTVLTRQRGEDFPKDSAEAEELLDDLREALAGYLKSFEPQPVAHSVSTRLKAIIGLCQTVSFEFRTNPSR